MGLLCLVGLCCFLPMVVGDAKDTIHTCPRCGETLGKHKFLLDWEGKNDRAADLDSYKDTPERRATTYKLSDRLYTGTMYIPFTTVLSNFTEAKPPTLNYPSSELQNLPIMSRQEVRRHLYSICYIERVFSASGLFLTKLCCHFTETYFPPTLFQG